MSQIQSNSSYTLSSAIQFNSKSLNPLDSIHPSIINKIKRQAQSYTNCSKKCANIWQALKKNDLAGQNLTQKVMQNIFKEYQNDLYTLTKMNSLRQFMKNFDTDQDGALNADQQIQIFSYIKERLQLTANNCLQIQLYIKFESLMNQVRELEKYIAKWQEELRVKIHASQMKKYKNEGQNRIDEFCDYFDSQFTSLQKIMIEKRSNFQQRSYYESQILEEKLSQSTQYLKIKPNNRIKELQVQEKLVSLEQRVYQALDFRRELNQLQIKEKDRVDKLMLEHSQKQRENLRNKHAKQRKELQIKLQELENKLVIKMKRQFQVLRKKNKLHEIEIRRLQGLEKKWAAKKGLFQPELKRTKKIEKQRNQVLENFKKSIFKSGNGLQQSIASEQTGENKFNAKKILNNTTKFKLTHKVQSDIALNTKQIQIKNDIGSRINKYILPKSNEQSYSLSKMYDNGLQPINTQQVQSQSIKNQQKDRKYNFIMDKLRT